MKDLNPLPQWEQVLYSSKAHYAIGVLLQAYGECLSSGMGNIQFLEALATTASGDSFWKLQSKYIWRAACCPARLSWFFVF